MQDNYYLGFSEFSGIGPKRFAYLCNAFGSAENAWNAPEEGLRSILGSIITQKFIDFRETFSFESLQEKLFSLSVSFVTLDDKDYPNLLREIPFPPFILYVKGNLTLLNQPKLLAVVGARKVSSYGVDVTTTITKELVEKGYGIVSGLAVGVDAIAHATTLTHNGSTIAVLGCGVDCCNPVQNQRIYEDILDKGGTIISAFRVGENPSKGSFPARNSIIAGISRAVLVTEGAEDSGSLITANHARSYKRPVFAVPGPINSHLSKGTNKLLQSGGVMVTSARDISNVILTSSEVEVEGSSHQNDKKYSKEEQEILDILKFGPLHFDQIVQTIGKSAKEVASQLSMMELKGMIKNRGGEYRI